MARPTAELIYALRETAARLASEAEYQWGHMGMCNCGHLARSITGLSEREIHQSALVREGDWQRQAEEYCPTSGLLIDHVIAAMLMIGMTRQDIGHLEKLSDPEVVHRLGYFPERNHRSHAIDYMRAWADLLEKRGAKSEERKAPVSPVAPRPSLFADQGDSRPSSASTFFMSFQTSFLAAGLRRR